MKNPREWKIGRKELNLFLLIISIIYFFFVLVASIILAEFGFLYGFDKVFALFLLEISITFVFMIYFHRCKKTKKDYYHLMVLMTLFQALVFFILVLTVNVV